MGKLGYKDEMVVATLCTRSMANLNTFTPQNLYNTIWAMETLGYKDEVILAALSKAIIAKLDGFIPQNI
jgi:hypothetical protein